MASRKAVKRVCYRPPQRDWRDGVIGMRDGGDTYQEIVDKCAANGHSISKSMAHGYVSKQFTPHEYTPTSLKDRKLFSKIRDFVLLSYLDDSEATVEKIRDQIKEKFSEEISDAVVRRIREECGLICYNTRYGHSVREVNRPLRVSFCEEQIRERNSFTHHVFTDECMVQLSANSRFCFCLRGDVMRRVKSTHKNPVKTMIWGGISWDGPTPLIFLEPSAKIDAGLYQAMMDSVYKPWASRTFGEHAVLIQDNAPSHSARSTRDYFKQENIRTIDWPAESPDLNAVEVVWANLKMHLQNVKKPKNIKELKEGIQQFWEDHLTVQQCRTYIKRVQSQMRRVIELGGAPVFD